MRFPRSSGVLLHPTSLPGPGGIGDLGSAADAFVDFLAAAGQSVWQVLPLGPTGYGDSPYQCFSASAGNPLLVSLEALREQGLLERGDLADPPVAAGGAVDYGTVIPWKRERLERAAARLDAGGAGAAAFRNWCATQNHWLEDYALFAALKRAHAGAPWVEWPAALRTREARAIAQAREQHAGALHAERFAQWCFFSQWSRVRERARARGISLFGDAPIFVAHDSADVWARPDLFQLDVSGRPLAVAGVPPDYFSETGQLWGNPLYRWDVIAAEGYAWWIARMRALLATVDRVRIDHFIGFARGWEVPAGAPDAREGRFRPGPGADLFEALERALGPPPIVAEDLGVVTPEVEALRDRFAFPGMKVLQFAFGDGAANPFLPHGYGPNAIAYTGTHDNDTTAGWWAASGAGVRDHVQRYLGREVADPAWELMRLGSASIADGFVAPMQDVLGLGSEARMNFPGRPAGNWAWRLADGAANDALAARLRELAGLYGRLTR